MLSPCSWPRLIKKSNQSDVDNENETVYAVILADVHMIGPRKGHPIDRWRREWEMHRAYQTILTMFQPDIVFMLGDIFDEGTYVNNFEFEEYVNRFHSKFFTPEYTRLVAVMGNHDIGFHYRAHPYYVYRFDQAFNTTGVQLISIKNNHFVVINSIAMEGDYCDLCAPALVELNEISKKLNCSRGLIKCNLKDKIGKYSQPILLQHYPLYRPSDLNCTETEKDPLEFYRERWEVISRKSTIQLSNLLNPRVAFSGHSHRNCYMEKNYINIEEYTITSFNWRNRPNPGFLLARFTPNNYRVVRCDLPTELTIYLFYAFGGLIIIILIILKCCLHVKNNKKSLKEL